MTTFFLSLLYLAVNGEYNVTYSSKCVWSYCVPFFHFYDLLRLNCQNISFVNSDANKKMLYTNSYSLSMRQTDEWTDGLDGQPAHFQMNQQISQPPTSNLADWMDKWTGTKLLHFGLITCIPHHVFISLNAIKSQQEASWQTTVVIFSPWHERSRPMSNWSTFSKRKLKSNQFKAVLLITRKLFVELWTCL